MLRPPFPERFMSDGDFRPSTMLECFENFPDPRVTGRCTHERLEIIAIILCATIVGADDFESMADFAIGRESWFRERLGLKLVHGIPSHDTLNRVMAMLDPKEFGERFARLVALVASRIPEADPEPIALDGKAMRGSKKTGRADRVERMVHMVSAWSVRLGLTLAQVRAEEKSNEITAIPDLLKLLDLSGALVTIDAAGCQKEIATQIVGEEGDYLLQVKGNQERLHEDLIQLVPRRLEHHPDAVQEYEDDSKKRSHGRLECRTCHVIDDPKCLESGIRDFALWTGLKSVIAVTRLRQIGDKTSIETGYYISSRLGTAEAFLKATRSHWAIENRCHWILDVAFREDDHRLREGHAPENLSTVRKMALMMLKQVKIRKGIQNKRLKAGWDNRFLERILQDFLEN
jgi:predicted transposase YbfD/YdcC